MKTEETVFLLTLGCPKNQVDSEILSASLLREGFAFVADPSEADVIILNSCSFVTDAVEESVTTLESLAQYREEGRCRCLVLAGCLVERYGSSLPGLLPHTDLFLGVRAEEAAGALVSRHLKGNHPQRLILGPPPRGIKTGKGLAQDRSPLGVWTYVKIAEGCSNACSYCTLPSIRGPLKSRTRAGIVREVESLAEKGAVEINLVAQDVAAYGMDRKRGSVHPLVRLLEQLQRIEAVRWIRLLYCHPAHVDRGLLHLMAESEKICPYMDLPIQHVSTPVLKAMKRPYNEKTLRNLIENLRQARPDIALRTTVMVGFPGETSSDFKRLLSFLREIRFHHLGVFPYSPEQGTKAGRRKETVQDPEKQRRVQAVMELQAGISETIQKQYLGTEQDILVEGLHEEDPGLLRARTRYQAPEVDGIVVLSQGAVLLPGIYRARIVNTGTYDLEGEIMAEPAHK